MFHAPNSHEAQLRSDWEKRAATRGDSPEGVLLQNLPRPLNDFLHQWHVGLIQNQFLPLMPPESRVLDVASGYGRISLPIQAVRPDIHLFGLDFSHIYCQHYAVNVQSPVVCGSVYDLPFANHFVDGIVAITALMYISTSQQKIVFSHLTQLLKPGGYALFIDPGLEYLKTVSLYTRSQSSTSGQGFKKDIYLKMGATETTRVVQSGGCPVFSVFMPLLYALANNQRIIKKLLEIIRAWENRVGMHHRYVLHRWMLVERIG